MSLTDYEAMRQQWYQAREAQVLADWKLAIERSLAQGQAIAYKLAHWRHRADEVCGKTWDDCA